MTKLRIHNEGVMGAIGKAGEVADKVASNIWVIVASSAGPALVSILNRIRSQESILRDHVKEAKKACKVSSNGNKTKYEKCVRKYTMEYAKGFMSTTKQQITLLQQALPKTKDPKKKEAIKKKIAKLQRTYDFFKFYAQNLQNQSMGIDKARKMAYKRAKKETF